MTLSTRRKYFIESQTGVRQGDPLAALLFSIAIHSVYDAVAKEVSGGCYAYVDDSNPVGTLEECWRAWEVVQTSLQLLSLEVNAFKCEITCFYENEVTNDRDQEALTLFRSLGLKVNTQCVNVLGCVVGRDDAAVAAELRSSPRYTDSHAAAFRRLPLMKKQTAMLALQRLDGVILTNRLRAMPPAATEHHAAAHDAGVLKTAHALTGITPMQGNSYDEQLQSTLATGGFGLTSAKSIAPAAYLAGIESTLRCSRGFSAMWADEGVAVALPPTSPLYASITDSLTRLAAVQDALAARCNPDIVRGLDCSILPASAATFIQHYRCGPPRPIQATVTQRISTLSYIARVTEARNAGKGGEATVARLAALREADSSLWLRTVPSHPGLTLTDSKWLWAARLRLGMPVDVVSNDCDACSRANMYTADSWHSLTCLSRSGPLITRRHNSVLEVVAKYCKMIDVAVLLNPPGDSQEDDRKADIEVYLPDRTIVGDVTVSHPTAKSWRKKISKHGIHVLGDEREAGKVGQYRAMAEQCDKEFQAIVMHTYGGLHQSAVTFLNAICNSLDPALCLLTRAEFKAELRAHIAIALQRGNAAIMIEDSVRVRAVRRGRRWRGRRWRGRRIVLRQPKKSLLIVDDHGRQPARGSPVFSSGSGVADTVSDDSVVAVEPRRCCADADGTVPVSGVDDGGDVVSGADGCGTGAMEMPRSDMGVGDGRAHSGLGAGAALADQSAQAQAQALFASLPAMQPPSAASVAHARLSVMLSNAVVMARADASDGDGDAVMMQPAAESDAAAVLLSRGGAVLREELSIT